MRVHEWVYRAFGSMNRVKQMFIHFGYAETRKNVWCVRVIAPTAYRKQSVNYRWCLKVHHFFSKWYSATVVAIVAHQIQVTKFFSFNDLCVLLLSLVVQFVTNTYKWVDGHLLIVICSMCVSFQLLENSYAPSGTWISALFCRFFIAPDFYLSLLRASANGQWPM